MPLLGDLYEEMAGVEELHRVRNILSPLINGSLAAYNRPTKKLPAQAAAMLGLSSTTRVCSSSTTRWTN